MGGRGNSGGCQSYLPPRTALQWEGTKERSMLAATPGARKERRTRPSRSIPRQSQMGTGGPQTQRRLPSAGRRQALTMTAACGRSGAPDAQGLLWGSRQRGARTGRPPQPSSSLGAVLPWITRQCRLGGVQAGSGWDHVSGMDEVQGQEWGARLQREVVLMPTTKRGKSRASGQEFPRRNVLWTSRMALPTWELSV